jgi:hypothetical protein
MEHEEVEGMARRRYVTNEISLDEELNQLAMQHGDFVALFYTWGITHAEDDAVLSGSPEKLRMRVVPGRSDKTAADITHTLRLLADAGLVLWDEQERMVQFPVTTFYRVQSYIPAEKRRTENIANNYSGSANISDEQRQTPTNSVSPSPSPSPIPTPTPSPTANVGSRSRSKNDYAADFEEWWAVYPHPRRDEKGRAGKHYATLRNKGIDKDRLLRIAQNYAAHRKDENPQYHKKAANFLGEDATWMEFEEPVAIVEGEFRFGQTKAFSEFD